jgi:hypothetical protein
MDNSNLATTVAVSTPQGVADGKALATAAPQYQVKKRDGRRRTVLLLNAAKNWE